MGNGIEDWEVLDLLTSLTDKSLVVFEERSATDRYRLPETIRQYAQERLAATAESDLWRARHRDYFLMLAEEVQPNLRGAEQAHWLSVLEAEHVNLRQAMAFCLEDAASGEAGLRLVSALQQFWQVRGHLSEGREWMSAVLGHADGREHAGGRANVLSGAGRLAWMQGDYAAARSLHEESLTIQQELGHRQGIALPVQPVTPLE